ncbi:MAG: HDOD domain-containing protein [Planctomycetota bacterium]
MSGTAADAVLQTIRGISALPALPVVVQTLMRDIADPRSHMLHISHLLGHDQALAARILRVANSPFYATREPVRSLEQAVPLLGLRQVNAILLKATLFDSYASRSARGIWLHALGAACATRAVARIARLTPADEAFALGLLHDIGKLALQEAFPTEYRQVREIVAQEGGLIRQAEQRVFGCDHAEAGRCLIERWSLPVDFIEAVGCHHQLAAASPSCLPWAAACHLGDIVARAMLIGNGGDRSIPALDPVALQALRITGSSYRAIFTAAEEELARAAVFFNVLDS